jgi:phosphatidylserine/phosphatidylglycerophosphate/cardiolipin synthase-like enzyme
VRAVAVLLFVGCAHAPDVVLVESVPLETSLARADVPAASDVWLDMVRGARRSIDLAEFYVSDAPGSRLHAVLDEIERAATRGVHVRLLVDETFYAKYPEVPDAWKARQNMEVHRINLEPGVMHAKYFIVDGREAYIGSQNFDWRSLEHIFEVGARIRVPRVVATLERVFVADWTGGQLAAEPDDMLGVSPEKSTPRALWDLPRLLACIRSAKATVHVEVLTYKTKARDGSDFHALDDALRDAARRGVHVQLLVSTWGEHDEAVVALSKEPSVEVRVLEIPKYSGGDIPFARVAHAKYAVFDGRRGWIGTSNWEGDYFTQSRNVGLFLDGDVPARLESVFGGAWQRARPPTF